MNLFFCAALCSAAIDAVAGCVALAVIVSRKQSADHERRLGVADLSTVALIMAASFVVKLPVAFLLGCRLFGLFHLVYLDVTVAVPVVCLSVLLLAVVGAWRWGKCKLKPAVWATTCVGVLAAPAGVYATFVEPYRLVIERTNIPLSSLNGSDSAITIAVLADLQFDEVTDYERGVVEQAMALKPDIIVLPGDIFQGTQRAFEEHVEDIRSLLEPLQAPGGVFLVDGDCDTPQRLRILADGGRIRFLYNEVVSTGVRGSELLMAGIANEFNSRVRAGLLEELQARRHQVDVSILLAHRPDHALLLPAAAPFDLIISGHTHGGQVQVPGFGPLLTLSRVPRHAAAGGLNEVNGQLLYVSRGVGMERGHAPRLRLFCRPEVSLLTLTGHGRSSVALPPHSSAR